ncbi:thioredoxin [Pontibacter sp. 172403-2]|uniref:thioredoxin family protein n=1 Tax=Pontibacter rufus TaxID=2791028 RepID=UPI0018AFD5B3|nr:protein disulfide isomerase family protein [Pontibacter sp. 172403-2]MBF9254560.1 thioredoxin [Pontibacter sp. 172403-2]
MPLIDEVTDKDLRMLVYKHDFVMVKFIDDDCPVCKELAPAYHDFILDHTYKDVQFMRMNAVENPVSRRQVSLTGTPFIATYYKGRLQECGLVTTASQIKDMLDRLLLHSGN